MTEAGPPAKGSENSAIGRTGDGWLRRLALLLLRLSLVVLLGFLLGLGVYYGAPALWRAATEPIVANTARIEDLEAQLQALQESRSDEEDASAAQMAGLEGQTASQGERISELEANLIDLESKLAERSRQGQAVDELSAEVDSMQRELRRLERMQAVLDRTATPGPALEWERQVQRLRVMELIARARVEILLDNYGLARENIAMAQDSLRVLIQADSATDVEDLREALERLGLAQEALDETPSLAANDLDSAWRLLVEATAPEDPDS